MSVRADDLTERELEILRLIAAGRSNHDIATQLFLTIGTVKWYNQRIFDKLQASSRTEAVALARELGYLDAAPSAPTEPRRLPPSNLPTHATTFVGREHELGELTALLSQEQVRLLTLAGPGGIGKTRLAIETARGVQAAFEHSACYVDCAPLTGPDQVVSTLAIACGYRFRSAGLDAPQELIGFLQDKQYLLVLDNFESVLSATPWLHDLLLGAPRVKLLVTSREILKIAWEWVYDVPGLALPDPDLPPQALQDSDAVQLFEARARQIRPRFALADQLDCVLRICRQVGGAPLAIELAASWLRGLPCGEVADEVQENLDFLVAETRQDAGRHRSIRAVFESTWHHLTPDEQAAFAGFSAFRGGSTLDAAQAILGVDARTLARMVDKSLLRHSGETRYEIHELLRQYGAEMLAKDGAREAQLQRSHVAYFTALVERETPAPALRAELGNLRAAVEYLTADRSARNNPTFVQDLASLHEGVGDVLAMAGQYDPARAAFGDAQTALGGSAPIARARLARKIAETLDIQRHPEEAQKYLEVAGALLSHEPSTDSVTWWSEWIDIHLEHGWSCYLLHQSDENARLLEAIRPAVEEHGSATQRTKYFRNLHLITNASDRWTGSEDAIKYARLSLESSEQTDNSSDTAFAMFVLGNAYWYRREWHKAEQLLCATLEYAIKADAVESQVLALTYLAVLYRLLGDRQKTLHYAERGLAGAARIQNPLYLGTAHANLACLAWRDGDLEEVQRQCVETSSAWDRSAAAAPYAFKWTGLWPMLGLALRQARIADAVTYAAGIADPIRQRMPADIEGALSDAIKAWDSDDAANAQTHLNSAVQFAEKSGYL